MPPPPLYLDKCTSLGDGITLRRWDPLVLVSPAVTYWRSGEICISWWVLPWVFLIAGYPSVVFLRWQWLSQGGSHWSCWLQIDPSLCYFDGSESKYWLLRWLYTPQLISIFNRRPQHILIKYWNDGSDIIGIS